MAAPEHAVVDALLFRSQKSAAATISEAPIDAVEGSTTASSYTNPRRPAAADEQDMAHDDAVLDMIALEMGATDFDEPEPSEIGTGEPMIAEPEPAPELIADCSDPRIIEEREIGA